MIDVYPPGTNRPHRFISSADLSHEMKPYDGVETKFPCVEKACQDPMKKSNQVLYFNFVEDVSGMYCSCNILQIRKQPSSSMDIPPSLHSTTTPSPYYIIPAAKV